MQTKVSKKQLLILLLLVCLLGGVYWVWSWFHERPLLFTPVEPNPVKLTALSSGKKIDLGVGTLRFPSGLEFTVTANVTQREDGSSHRRVMLRLKTKDKSPAHRCVLFMDATEIPENASSSKISVGSVEPQILRKAIETPGWNPAYLAFRDLLTSQYGTDLKIQKIDTPRLSGFRLVGHSGDGRTSSADEFQLEYLLLGVHWTYHIIYLGDAQTCSPDTFAKIVGSFSPAL